MIRTGSGFRSTLCHVSSREITTMGGSSTKTKRTRKASNNNMCEAYNVVSSPPRLTVEQQRLLSRIWLALKDDIAKVGVITFVNLFETHPEVHDAFMPFRSLETSQLEYSSILRAHALRVMGTVDKCISRLDRPDKLKELMTDLGIRHQAYNAGFEFIDLMGPQFITSIRNHLQDEWTDDYEEAWSALFNMMTFYMKKGITSI